MGRLSPNLIIGVSLLFLLAIGWTSWSLELHPYRFAKNQGSAIPAAQVSRPWVDESFVSDAAISNSPEQPPAETSLATAPLADGKSDRPLILYTYFETDKARFNLEFFIKHGLHAHADFVFILSGDNKAEKLLPQKSNIRFIKRENDCYDLGAYAETLLKDDLYKKYKKFILINASLRGPFVPYWSEACWSDMFLKRITDDVKLVGMTANCWPLIHVQSMILATDSIGMEVLLFPPEAALENMKKIPDYNLPGHWPPYPGINNCFHDWNSAVSAEIGTSALMVAAGYKLDVMMSAYHGGSFDLCVGQGVDFLNKDTYYGISYHPYETIFFKTNRVVEELVIDRYTGWTDGRNYSSYDWCKA